MPQKYKNCSLETVRLVRSFNKYTPLEPVLQQKWEDLSDFGSGEGSE